MSNLNTIQAAFNIAAPTAQNPELAALAMNTPKGVCVGFRHKSTAFIVGSYKGVIVAAFSALNYWKPLFYGEGLLRGLSAADLLGGRPFDQLRHIPTEKSAGYPDRWLREDPHCLISQIQAEYGLDLELIVIAEHPATRELNLSRVQLDEDWRYPVASLVPVTVLTMDTEWVGGLAKHFPAIPAGMAILRDTVGSMRGLVTLKAMASGCPEVEEPEAVSEPEEVEADEPAPSAVRTPQGRQTPPAPRPRKPEAVEFPAAAELIESALADSITTLRLGE